MGPPFEGGGRLFAEASRFGLFTIKKPLNQHYADPGGPFSTINPAQRG
jgi:hypothetical protein